MTAPRKPYLLFADDDPDDKELFAEQFLRYCPGVPVHYCKDGHEVLAYLDQCPTAELPLVMLLDYRMPITTGAQVLALTSKTARYRPIRKLVWSTSGSAEFMTECLGYGADRYFVKPSDIGEMEKIAAYIAGIFRPSLQPQMTR